MEMCEDGVAYVHKPGENSVPSLSGNNKDGNCSRSQDANINPVLSLQDEW